MRRFCGSISIRLIDAELVDPYTIRFVTKEPYFLNESVLGGITMLPRHYYDPENLLQRS